MLIASSLSVRRGRRRILEGIDLCVRPGEVLALIGPNGAGKSTLLAALCAELSPSRGAVLLDGRPLGRLRLGAVARRLAVLPQESRLDFPFTALEIALLGRIPHEGAVSTRGRDEAIAAAALERAGVAHLRERAYPTLSGGERQRVQLARVLAQLWNDEPPEEDRYLLLDEPVSSLDPAHQHAVLRLARTLASESIGVVAVLHDLNLAAQYADRIALLAQGSIVAEGSPAEVLAPELLQQTFELPVRILSHPDLGCPLVLPLGSS